MRSALFLFAGALLVACDAKPVDPPPPSSSSAPTSSPTSTSNPTSTAKSNAALPARDPVEQAVADVTKTWNDALAARNAEGLKNVYASNVRLYTVEMTREKALKTKADALKGDYTQSISFLEIDTRKKDAPRAAFNKKWSIGGKEQQVRGFLVFTKEANRWVIREETDGATEALRLRAAKNQDGCESLVQQLASSTPEATRILGQRPDPSKGHISNGTRLGGGPPDSPKYSVAIHENHEDRIVTLLWIDVDPKTGAMTNGIDDSPIQPGAPDLVEKMRVACANASR